LMRFDTIPSRPIRHGARTSQRQPWHWRDQFRKVNAPSRDAARLARARFGYLLR
jgi:hypothetical protein